MLYLKPLNSEDGSGLCEWILLNGLLKWIIEKSKLFYII